MTQLAKKTYVVQERFGQSGSHELPVRRKMQIAACAPIYVTNIYRERESETVRMSFIFLLYRGNPCPFHASIYPRSGMILHPEAHLGANSPFTLPRTRYRQFRVSLSLSLPFILPPLLAPFQTALSYSTRPIA